MQKTKGFTIIELLVVIAIIAVLAAIVLVNVTVYINKGKDAAIKGNLTTVMTNAAVFFDTNANYTGFAGNATLGCGAGGPIAAAITAAGSTLVCAETTTTGAQWCGCAQEKVDATKYYCVDSSGAKIENTTACTTSCTAASPLCL